MLVRVAAGVVSAAATGRWSAAGFACARTDHTTAARAAISRVGSPSLTRAGSGVLGDQIFDGVAGERAAAV
jgi:hypothetical protein